MKVSCILLIATLTTCLPLYAQHEGHGGSGTGAMPTSSGGMGSDNTASRQMVSMFALQANPDQSAHYHRLVTAITEAKEHASALAGDLSHAVTLGVAKEHSRQLHEALARGWESEGLLEGGLNPDQASSFKTDAQIAERLHLQVNQDLWDLDHQLSAATINLKQVTERGRKIRDVIAKWDKTTRKVGTKMGLDG